MMQTISHELRTPLNCSIGMLEILKPEDFVNDSKYHNFIEPAILSNYFLLNVINDIIDHALIDTDKFQLKNEQFNLYEIFIESLKYFQYQAKFKKISIFIEIPDYFKKNDICSDKQRLKQVI